MIGERWEAETERTPARAATIAVVVPQLAVAAMVVVMLCGPLAGDAFWPVRDVNLAEAVLLRDAGEAVRLIGSGENPNGLFPVRREIADVSGRVTPLEAAAIERRVEMVDLLLRHGAAIGDEAHAGRLMCLAAARGAPDVAAFLSRASGHAVPASCQPVH